MGVVLGPRTDLSFDSFKEGFQGSSERKSVSASKDLT
jgi:hypothetical protein